MSSIVIKNEVPEPLPEVVDEITSKTEPAETSEQGTHFLAGADASSEKPEKETKIDDPDKELSELQIAEDAPVDDKEKENKKPGVKVNIFFALIWELEEFVLSCYVQVELLRYHASSSYKKGGYFFDEPESHERFFTLASVYSKLLT